MTATRPAAVECEITQPSSSGATSTEGRSKKLLGTAGHDRGDFWSLYAEKSPRSTNPGSRLAAAGSELAAAGSELAAAGSELAAARAGAEQAAAGSGHALAESGPGRAEAGSRFADAGSGLAAAGSELAAAGSEMKLLRSDACVMAGPSALGPGGLLGHRGPQQRQL